MQSLYSNQFVNLDENPLYPFVLTFVTFVVNRNFL